MWPFGRRNDTRCDAPTLPSPANGGGSFGKDARFMIEEPLFGRQPATEPGQRTVGADDPVAGEHDADGIRAVRGAERSGRRRDAERGGLPAVAGRGAEGDLAWRPPVPQLA